MATTKFVPKKVTPAGRTFTTVWNSGSTSTGGHGTGTYTTGSGITYHYHFNVAGGPLRGNWSGSFAGRIGVR